MTARVIATVATVAITLIATGCDQANTANNTVAITSPAGTSSAPSSPAARDRDEALPRMVHRFYTIVILGSARSTPRLEAFLIEDALVP